MLLVYLIDISLYFMTKYIIKYNSDPLEAVKHSKGDSMDYIAPFLVMNPHQ